MTDKMDPDEINPKWAQGDFFRILVFSDMKVLREPYIKYTKTKGSYHDEVLMQKSM